MFNVRKMFKFVLCPHHLISNWNTLPSLSSLNTCLRMNKVDGVLLKKKAVCLNLLESQKPELNGLTILPGIKPFAYNMINL